MMLTVPSCSTVQHAMCMHLRAQSDVRLLMLSLSGIAGCDTVFHCATAAPAAANTANRKLMHDVNVRGTENIIAACASQVQSFPHPYSYLLRCDFLGRTPPIEHPAAESSYVLPCMQCYTSSWKAATDLPAGLTSLGLISPSE